VFVTELKGRNVDIRWTARLIASLCIAGILACDGHGESDNSLFAAAEKGDLQRIKSVAPGSAEVNARDGRGYTPLMAAASAGHTEVMRALIERGAEVNAADNSASTALHIAAAYGNGDALRLLISSGADSSLRNNLGFSARDIAQNSQKPEIVAMFDVAAQPAGQVESGEDPNNAWMRAALVVISDPAVVAKRVSEHKDLEQGVAVLSKSGQDEVRAWVQRGPAQRTRLARAVQQQVRAELRLIQDVAGAEKAAKTLADANALQNAWDKRMEAVSERIREARRQEMAMAAGRTVPVRRSGPAVVGPLGLTAAQGPDPNKADKGYFSQAQLRGDQERLAEAWVSASEDVDRLATEVNDLSLRDLGYLRTTAVAEKASDKTVAAIDAVMVIRSQRHAAVRAAIGTQNGTGVVAPGGPGEAGYGPGQRAGRGGVPGGSTQGQENVPYRGGRRTR